MDSGTWELHYQPDRYATTNRRIAAGTAGVARFTPTLPQAGTYDVFAWWPVTDSTTGAVPFTVHGNGVTQTTALNESQTPGAWVLIGRYPLAQGSYVTVEANAGVDAVADAVEFSYVGP